MHNLVNNIKGYRILSGLTQSQLAAKIGTSKNTISSYECGKYSPSAFHAILLCSVFDCKFEDLFYLQ